MSGLPGWVRSPLGVAVGVVVGCLVGVGGALLITQSPQQAASERAAPTLPLVTAQVVSQQLVDATQVRCGYESRELPAVAPRAAGRLESRVVTAIEVATGDTLRSGELVAAVSGEPLIAFVTDLPFYRDLSVGDRGPDVRALEEGLVVENRLERADDRFDSTTLAAVEAVYREAGWADRRRFVADAAWAVPAGSRVSAVQVAVGDTVEADTALVVAQSGDGRWQCRIPAGIDVQPGDTWEVSGGDEPATATVTDVGRDEETRETVATVTLPDAIAADTEVAATVVAQISDGEVLTVPAGALFTAADSTAAVRVVAEETVREVPVATGVAAGGWVEVSGDGLAAGQTVQIRGA